MAKKRTTNKRDQSDISNWIERQTAGRRRSLPTALSDLRKAYDSRKSESLLWWHRVGGLVAEFFPDGGRQYGSNVMEMLARELGAADEAAIKSVSNTLWQARTIAKALTLKEAKSWAVKRNSKGRRLSAYHIFAVAAVEDRELRTELLDACVAESWGVNRLRAEVQNRFGKKRSRGGRKPLQRETPSPLVALREVELAARHWMANHKTWFVGRKSALGHVPKKLHTDELYEALGEAADALIEMQAAVDAGLGCLEGLATDVESKLNENRKR